MLGQRPYTGNSIGSNVFLILDGLRDAYNLHRRACGAIKSDVFATTSSPDQ